MATNRMHKVEKTPRERGEPRQAADPAWKSFLKNPKVALATRLVLGAFFIWSAGSKLAYPSAFEAILKNTYGVFPDPVVPIVAFLVPWIELPLGSFLVLGLLIRIVSYGAAVLLGMFLALMLVAIAQGKSGDCGCFVGLSESIGPWTVARDIAILALAGPTLMARRHLFSGDTWLASADRANVRYFGTVGAAALLTVAVGLSLGSFYKAPIEAPPALSRPAASTAAASVPISNQTTASNPSASSRPNAGWRLGPENAKVVITEFGDFECPACQAADPVLKKLIADYQGQVALVYRHFPLQYHPFAVPAAEASEAAGEQGKFWEMHDLLFADQKHLALNDLQARASRLGLDMQQFDEAMASGRYKRIIADDFNEGRKVGVAYTPFILIDGQEFKDHSYGAMKAKIDQLLNK
ncbi:MAG: thioredoxin domain-containing protein [Chloroflexi bacterium]|nr:thioredoxin domain-containing protein [Chloroflexota bacterium]